MMTFSKQTPIIFIFLFLFTTVSYAQKRETAKANITTLKNGALFVRLKTSQLKIDGLKKMGKEKEAEEIRVNQENTNKAIVAAFKGYFDFCPVYFFYSNYSNEVKEGNYKGLIMDVNMETNSSFDSKNYLIGEFDESSNTQIDAFIIKDKNYVQLKKPFPFYVKAYEMGITTRPYREVVFILNKRFFEFYNK